MSMISCLLPSPLTPKLRFIPAAFSNLIVKYLSILLAVCHFLSYATFKNSVEDSDMAFIEISDVNSGGDLLNTSQSSYDSM